MEGIDLNKYYVEVSIMNNKRKDVFVKLPKTQKELEYSLMRMEVAEENQLKYTTFNKKIKSIKSIKKVDIITIKKPTNIYYLNMYLNLLKDKNINFASKKMEITTSILQKEIAKLIEAENEKLNYDEIKSFLEENNSRGNKEEQPTKKSKEKKKDKPKKIKFSIKELQRQHRERKGNYEK